MMMADDNLNLDFALTAEPQPQQIDLLADHYGPQ